MTKTKSAPTVHTSAFVRDLTSTVFRVATKCGKRVGRKTILTDKAFRDALLEELADRIDWDEVERRNLEA
jgi:hypothetical protein